ncbi:proteasome regulatory subunit S2 [Cryptosporidium ryanae]|uniref:proteasome regulatory subunit S2 n=1 Tax=Cryptosporidium ryanae TaxID=515981 RepID=UPI00351A5723|nr:proteasome regulatory subunit S2 [Cryptosporidium ryanae]
MLGNKENGKSKSNNDNVNDNEKEIKNGEVKIENMDLTEEEELLKNELDDLVDKILNMGFAEESKQSLKTLSEMIKTSASTMTSVPKVLKFLGLSYNRLKEFCDNQIKLEENKEKKSEFLTLLCEIVSILSTTLSDVKERKALNYRIKSRNIEGILNWGQEYIRNIVGELALEYNDRMMSKQEKDGVEKGIVEDTNLEELLKLVKLMIPYQIEKHCELEAIDLLCEVEQIEFILEYISKIDVEQMERMVLYLQQLSNYSISSDEHDLYLRICFELLLSFKRYTWAINIALRLEGQGSRDRVFCVFDKVMQDCKKGENGEKSFCLNMMKQMCFQLARFGSNILVEELHDHLTNRGFLELFNEHELSILENIFSNEQLNKYYSFLAKELDVLEPKTPDEIYKTHLEDGNSGNYSNRSMMVLDTAKQNLASTYVNALVNVGFCTDKLISEDESSSWLYKNKDSGKMAVSASMGVINLWNIDKGLANIDKFQWSDDPFTKAGALIAFGLISVRIKNECDPSFALLSEYINPEEENMIGDNSAGRDEKVNLEKQNEDVKMKDESEKKDDKPDDEKRNNNISIIKTVVPNYTIRMGAILGLGYSYIGTCRNDILELLIPILMDPFSSLECSAISALSLGLVFSGSCNKVIIEAVLDLLLALSLTESSCKGEGDNNENNSENDKKQPQSTSSNNSSPYLDDPLAILYGLCLGLLFLGKRESCEATLDAISVITHQIGLHCKQTIIGCAYTGSGDVLKIQEMQRILIEKTLSRKDKGGEENNGENDEDDESEMSILVSVLNIALISLGEEVGMEMALRALDNVLQYSSVYVRRAVPIGIAALSIGNPKPVIIDTVSKLTHDSDPDVALNAIFALGLISAGTNNARTANLLRQLASYYGKDKHALYAVRISQGMLYMGKGLVTINPIYSDKTLLNPITLISIVSTLNLALRSKTIFYGNYHYLLLTIVPGIMPRYLVTVDGSLSPIQTLVRVGQIVDTVGQAGNPRKITGFQTHNSPVLVGHNEKAEIATDEFVSMSDFIEDIVILERKSESMAE